LGSFHHHGVLDCRGVDHSRVYHLYGRRISNILPAVWNETYRTMLPGPKANPDVSPSNAPRLDTSATHVAAARLGFWQPGLDDGPAISVLTKRTNNQNNNEIGAAVNEPPDAISLLEKCVQSNCEPGSHSYASTIRSTLCKIRDKVKQNRMHVSHGSIQRLPLLVA
jgi:hypothetical protein